MVLHADKIVGTNGFVMKSEIAGVTKGYDLSGDHWLFVLKSGEKVVLRDADGSEDISHQLRCLD